ncbi:glutamate--tRNA ligase [Maritalea sp.]|uniref:glutamate--tRNA ligase n=1 Tax=Maritalea sp. TaxID=2003361 RepID=UPI003EF605AB
MTDKVITRFAPSPTGFLHIGNARTALFNWALAKSLGGEMLLRIEDTDKDRSTDEAIAAIITGMDWLGLDYAGEPIFQSKNIDRHTEIANQLLSEGKAYKCYATAEELTQMREKAKADGRPMVYDRRWRDRPESDAPANTPFVVRIKAPTSGEIVVHDKVQGDVHFKAENLDDFVILRSDGSPTYLLAVVVDDHDMGVTHILRGDDHLVNSARQITIYNALDWHIPTMAHTPLIHGPDGAKLSKRHGALGVEDYRRMGYLPETIRNYFARLGWAHGDEEIFSSEQFIEWFSYGGLNKGASRIDFAKMENVNAHYIKASEDARLFDLMVSLAEEIEDETALKGLTKHAETVREALPALKTRAKTILELNKAAEFIFAARPLAFEDKALAATQGENLDILRNVQPVLQGLNDWSHDGIDAALRAFAEQNDLKFGKVAQPIRAAVTAKNASPGCFDVLLLLGKEESLSRLSETTAV